MGVIAFQTYKPPEWFTSYETSNSFTGSQNWQNVTVRSIIPASLWDASGTKLRVTISGAPNPTGYRMGNFYFGEKASSGDPWDTQTDPDQVTWGGGNQTQDVSSDDVVSDEMNIAVDHTKDYIFSFYFSTVAGIYVPTGSTTEYVVYLRSLGDFSSIRNPTGFAILAPGIKPICVKKIEVSS